MKNKTNQIFTRALALLVMMLSLGVGTTWATTGTCTVSVTSNTTYQETFSDGTILYNIDSDGRVKTSSGGFKSSDIVSGGSKTTGACLSDKRFVVKFPVAVTGVTFYGYNSSTGREISKVSTSTEMTKDKYTESTCSKSVSSATPNYTYTFTTTWTSAVDANTYIWFELNNSCNIYKIEYTYSGSTYDITLGTPTNGTNAKTGTITGLSGTTNLVSSGNILYLGSASSSNYITATPADGYELKEWTVGSTTISKGGTGSITAATTITAVFQEQAAGSCTDFSLSMTTQNTTSVYNGELDLSSYGTISGGEAYLGNPSTTSGDASKATIDANKNIKLGGNAIYVRIVLPCALATGDVISFTNSSSDANGICFTKTSTRATTYSATVTSPYTVDENLAGTTTLYVWRSSNSAFIKTLTITRKSSEVPVISIILDNPYGSMYVGETATITLTPTVAPDDATDSSIDWTTSDDKVATVSNGVVTAVGAGDATITATAHDGSGVTATCGVTVNAAATGTNVFTMAVVSGKSLSIPASTSYYLNSDYVTVTGGAVSAYNAKTSNNNVVNSGAINLGGSSSSYLKVDLKTALTAGDLITFTGTTFSADADAIIINSDGKSSSKTITTRSTYIVTSSDGIVGKSTIYFMKSNSAQFKGVTIQHTYSITYDNKSHGTAPANVTNATALPATLPTMSEDGYTFDGWFTDESLTTAAVAGATLTANTTLYAKWTEVTPETKTIYVKTIDSWTADGVKTAVYDATNGKWLGFMSASTGCNEGYLTYDIPVSCSTVVLGRFDGSTTTLPTSGWNDGASTNPSGFYNQTTNVDFSTNNLYTMTGWGNTGEADGKVYGSTSNYTVKYSVTYNSNGGSTVESVCVANGGVISTLPTPTKSGYSLEGWYSDEELTTQFTTSTAVNSDLTVYAKWTVAAPTVSIDATGTWGLCAGGTISMHATATNTLVAATYQWYLNGSAIEGATIATYTKASCTAADAGEYTCKVTNDASHATTSSGFKVRIYQLGYGKSGASFNYYPFVAGSGQTGTYTATLEQNQTYEFKVYDGSSYWGLSSSETITTDGGSKTLADGGSNNVKLQAYMAGSYTFTLDYSGTPKITMTYPSGNQASGKTVYFEKPDDWGGTPYFRVGHDGSCEASSAGTLVSGTARLYKMTTPEFNKMQAWHVGNNYGWTNTGNSIFKTTTNSTDGLAITKSSEYQFYAVGDDGVTLVLSGSGEVGSETDKNNNCTFYTATKYTGMLTHKATITAPTNGTITIDYTEDDGNGNEVSKSTTETKEFAHTYKLTITPAGATGYGSPVLKVGDDAVTLTDGKYSLVLTDDVTLSATFSAKTYTITLNKGTNGSADGSATATYNSGTLAGYSAATAADNYTLKGYYTETSDGIQVIDADGNLIANVSGYTDASGNWTKDEACTLYAQWTEESGTCSNLNSTTVTKSGDAVGGVVITYDSDSKTSANGISVSKNIKFDFTSVGKVKSFEFVATCGSDNKVNTYSIDGGSAQDLDKSTTASKTYTVTIPASGATTIQINKSGTTPVLTKFCYELLSTHTVTFNKNDGTSTTAKQEVVDNIATNLNTLSTIDWTRDGYVFLGWAESADGDVVYADGASVTLTADKSLYAKWAKTFYSMHLTAKDAYSATGGTAIVANMNSTTNVISSTNQTYYKFDSSGKITLTPTDGFKVGDVLIFDICGGSSSTSDGIKITDAEGKYPQTSTVSLSTSAATYVEYTVKATTASIYVERISTVVRFYGVNAVRPSSGKTDCDLALSAETTSVTKPMSTTVTYTTSSTGTVTATSDAESVATVSVDQTTKTITITGVATGTANITVSQASTSAYEAGEKAIAVTVKAASITAADVNLTAAATTSGNIAYSLTNAVDGAQITATKKTTADWLTLGDVSASAVAFTTTANSSTTDARTATVTLTYTASDGTTVLATKDVTITQAKYIVSYTVTFDVDGETTPVAVESGNKVTSPNSPTKKGYYFAGWRADGASSNFDFGQTITASVTLKAQWTAMTANQFIYDATDAIHYDGTTYKNPEGKSATTSLSSSYSMYNPASADGITSITASATFDNKTETSGEEHLTSMYKLNKGSSKISIMIASGYTASLKLKVAGYTTNKPITVNVGSESFTTTSTESAKGKVYMEKTYDIAAGTTEISVPSTSSNNGYIAYMEVTATPVAGTYDVTASATPDGYGSVSPTSVTGLSGETSISANGNVLTVGSSTITATPTAATAEYTYAFSKWQIDGVDYTSATSISAAATVTAVFTREAVVPTYTVTVVDEKTSCSKNTSAAEGKTVTITNTCEVDGYTLTGYTSSPTVSGSFNATAKTYTFTMPGYNVTLTAVWEASTPVAASDFALGASTASVEVANSTTVSYTTSSTGAVSAKSNATGTATVSVDQSTKKITITGVAAGTATITVSQAATDAYAASGDKTITVTVNKASGTTYTYLISAITPSGTTYEWTLNKDKFQNATVYVEVPSSTSTGTVNWKGSGSADNRYLYMYKTNGTVKDDNRKWLYQKEYATTPSSFTTNDIKTIGEKYYLVFGTTDDYKGGGVKVILDESAVDPTVSFNNGSYALGDAALDLSTLFSSNSTGEVTYSVTDAGTTGATVSGTSFTATATGTATVQASQAATSSYNAKTVTATITVNAASAEYSDQIIWKKDSYYTGCVENPGSATTTSNYSTCTITGADGMARPSTAGTEFVLTITAKTGYKITNICTYGKIETPTTGLQYSWDGGTTWLTDLSTYADEQQKDFAAPTGGASSFTIKYTKTDGVDDGIYWRNALVTVVSGDVESHMVTCNTAENGAVTSDAAAGGVGAGTKVTLTITPNEGYVLNTLSVKDASGNDITLDDDNTFKMPNSNVTVTPTFKVMVKTYSITYHNNGHGVCPSMVSSATALPNPLPTMEADGYYLLGWYTDEGLTNPAGAGTVLSANADLYASWEEAIEVLPTDGALPDGFTLMNNGEIQTLSQYTMAGKPIVYIPNNNNTKGIEVPEYATVKRIVFKGTSADGTNEGGIYIVGTDYGTSGDYQTTPLRTAEAKTLVFTVTTPAAGQDFTFSMWKGFYGTIELYGTETAHCAQPKMSYDYSSKKMNISAETGATISWSTNADMSNATEYTGAFTIPSDLTQPLNQTYYAQATKDEVKSNIVSMTVYYYPLTNGYYLVDTKDELKTALLYAAQVATETSPKKIFVKNGTYDFDSKYYLDIPSYTSVIGESMEGVVIKNKVHAENTASNSAIMRTVGTGAYLQDLTLQNETGDGSDMQAAAFEDYGTNTVLKHVKLLGYQDTYYSKNTNVLSLVEDCEIHGNMDFICGSGDVFFNNCTLYVETKSSGTPNITAHKNPYKELSTSKGFVFNGCTIDGATGVASAYTLGRPWNDSDEKIMASTEFVGCTFKVQPNSEGWTTMTGTPKRYALVDCKQSDGETAFAPTYTNATWTAKNADWNAAIVATDYTLAKVLGDETMETAATQETMGTLTLSGTDLSWDVVGAGTYLVENSNVTPSSYVDLTAATSLTGATGTYTVRAANSKGGFGPAATTTTSHTATFNKNDGSDPAVTTTQSVLDNTATALKAIKTIGWTRDGYGFTGWNTQADGKGTAYTNEQEVSLTEDLTLYAQWEVASTCTDYYIHWNDASGVDKYTSVPANSNYFDLTVSGKLKTGATYDYNGATFNKGIKMESNTSISFTPKANGTVKMYFDAAGDVKLNNTNTTLGSGNCLEFTATMGTEYILTKTSTINLYVIEFKCSGKSLTSIAVKTPPTKTTTYKGGEYFDPTGLVIQETFSDNSTALVTYTESNKSNFSFTPSLTTPLTSVNTQVTITYGGKSTTQAITVAANSTIELTELVLSNGFNTAIMTDPSNNTYTVTGYYLKGTSKPSIKSFTINGTSGLASNYVSLNATEDELTVYAPDAGKTGSQVYKYSVTEVEPLTATTEQALSHEVQGFSWLKLGHWYDDPRYAYEIYKNVDDATTQRIKHGLNRAYLFVGPCKHITLTNNSTGEVVNRAGTYTVYVNGTETATSVSWPGYNTGAASIDIPVNQNTNSMIEIVNTSGEKGGSWGFTSVQLVPNDVTTYTVTFNMNDGTEAPETATQPNIVASTATVLTTIENIGWTRTGYDFAGWATTADGTVAYTDGGNVTLTADQTLYAKWTAKNYTITLDNQSATTAGTASVSATYDSNTNLTTVNLLPEKTDNTFGGYYTQADGAGVQLIDNAGNFLASVAGYTDASRNWIYADNVTLYAKWTASGKTETTITWPTAPTVYAGGKYTFTATTNSDVTLASEQMSAEGATIVSATPDATNKTMTVVFTMASGADAAPTFTWTLPVSDMYTAKTSTWDKITLGSCSGSGESGELIEDSETHSTTFTGSSQVTGNWSSTGSTGSASFSDKTACLKLNPSSALTYTFPEAVNLEKVKIVAAFEATTANLPWKLEAKNGSTVVATVEKTTDGSQYKKATFNIDLAGNPVTSVTLTNQSEKKMGIGEFTFTVLTSASAVKQQTNLAWTTNLGTTVSKKNNDADFTYAAASDNCADAVTYTSSEPTVATVNSSTGEVHILTAGTTVITATIAKNGYGCYAEKSISYTLDIEASCTASQLVLGAVSTSLILGESGTATTLIEKKSGDNPSTITYTIYSDSKCTTTTTDASVDATTGTFSTTTAGTYYIKGHQAEGTSGSVTYCETTSDKVTIKVAAKATPAVTWNVPTDNTVYQGGKYSISVTTTSDDALDGTELTISGTGASLSDKSVEGKTISATLTIATDASTDAVLKLTTSATAAYAESEESKTLTLESCSSATQEPTLTWSNGLKDDATVGIETGGTITYSASSTNSSGAITYKITIEKGDAAAKATVDENGKVTTKATGNVTVHATIAAAGCYKSKDITYDLKIGVKTATLTVTAAKTNLTLNHGQASTLLTKSGENTADVEYTIYTDATCTKECTSGATISGSTFQATATGTYYIMAEQETDGTYGTTRTNSAIVITVTMPIYQLTVLDEASGCAQAARSVTAGETVTIDHSCTLDGKEFQGYSSQPNLEITANGDEYSFVMPEDNVVLTAQWASAGCMDKAMMWKSATLYDGTSADNYTYQYTPAGNHSTYFELTFLNSAPNTTDAVKAQEKQNSSLTTGKVAGNGFLFTPTQGVGTFSQVRFTAKIQDDACLYTTDGTNWQVLSSSNTSSDQQYIINLDGAKMFGMKNDGTNGDPALGVWIRNMELEICHENDVEDECPVPTILSQSSDFSDVAMGVNDLVLSVKADDDKSDYIYQWYKTNVNGEPMYEISGATSSTFTIAKADQSLGIFFYMCKVTTNCSDTRYRYTTPIAVEIIPADFMLKYVFATPTSGNQTLLYKSYSTTSIYTTPEATPTNPGLTIDDENKGGKKGIYTQKISMPEQSDFDDTKYVELAFDVADGKYMIVSDINVNVQPVSCDYQKFKAILSDEKGHKIESDVLTNPSNGISTNISFDGKYDSKLYFVGKVTLRVYGVDDPTVTGHKTSATYRLGKTVTISGQITADLPKADLNWKPTLADGAEVTSYYGDEDLTYTAFSTYTDATITYTSSNSAITLNEVEDPLSEQKTLHVVIPKSGSSAISSTITASIPAVEGKHLANSITYVVNVNPLPSITASSSITIAPTDLGGSGDDDLVFTYVINNPVSGKEVEVQLSDNSIPGLTLTPAMNDGKTGGVVKFKTDGNTDTQNAKTAKVTLLYNYGGEQTVSKTVTLTQERRFYDKLDGNNVATSSATYSVAALPITVSKVGWASTCLPYNAVIPAGVKVYYASGLSEGKMTLKRVLGIIPAGQGVIFKATPGTVTFEPADAGASVTKISNSFGGTVNVTTMTENANYVFTGINASGNPIFQPLANTKTGEGNIVYSAYKCYLPKTALQTGKAPTRVIFTIDDSIDQPGSSPTGLDEQNATDQVEKFFYKDKLYIRRNGQLYDAAGRLISNGSMNNILK